MADVEMQEPSAPALVSPAARWLGDTAAPSGLILASPAGGDTAAPSGGVVMALATSPAAPSGGVISAQIPATAFLSEKARRVVDEADIARVGTLLQQLGFAMTVAFAEARKLEDTGVNSFEHEQAGPASEQGTIFEDAN